MATLVTLVVTIGLPGSGKSTAAAQWVAADPARRARVGRDGLRMTMHGPDAPHGERWLEDQVTLVQDAAILALLRAGISVAVDDTNFRQEYVQRLEDLAARAGARVEIWDFRDVPVEVCVARDAARPPHQRVGEARIREMAEQLSREGRS